MLAHNAVLARPARLKLLLIDDHPLFLDGLSLVLEHAYEAVEITSVSSYQEATDILQQHSRFDLITLDWSLPDGRGGALLRYLRSQQCYIPVLVVSATDNPLDLKLALNAGASGFVSKSRGRSALLSAIENVLAGEIVCDAGSLEQRVRELDEQTCHLTPRQIDVLERLGRGMSNKEICRDLNLTEHTVKSHLKALFQSLQVKNRTECVRRAQSMGLVDTNPLN